LSKPTIWHFQISPLLVPRLFIQLTSRGTSLFKSLLRVALIAKEIYLSLYKKQYYTYMEGAILHTNSNKDLDLILQLAEKLGISSKKLSKKEMEDWGLANAITKGKTNEYVDTESFLTELQNDR